MLKVQEFKELTGIEYLMADIACLQNKTFEKKQWHERIARFNEIDFTDPKTFKNASNPIGLRAAVLALEKTTQGEASGYMISLDAASSGLQLNSLMVECPVSWRLCGGDEEILDAYMTLYEYMDSGKNLTRKKVKDACMTAFYGSEATPKDIFKEDINLFYNTLEEQAPGAWDLNLAIQDLWDKIKGDTYSWELPDGFYACIETHDKVRTSFTFLDKSFELIQKVRQRPRFHKGLGPNLTHSVDGLIVREMLRRCMFDERVTTRVMALLLGTKPEEYTSEGKHAQKVTELWQNYLDSGFLSVRILDFLYQDTMGIVDPLVIAKMIQTLPNKSFDVVTVHDCFRCHPNYGNDLRKQYNQILCDIKNSNILSFIVKQLTNKNIKVNKVGTIEDDVILNGNYLLS